MNFTERVRIGLDKAKEIWADRDMHFATLKAVAKATPGKFREAPKQQKRAVVAAVITIIGLQILLLLAALL